MSWACNGNKPKTQQLSIVGGVEIAVRPVCVCVCIAGTLCRHIPIGDDAEMLSCCQLCQWLCVLVDPMHCITGVADTSHLHLFVGIDPFQVLLQFDA
jgi:hypothetical protein